MSRASVALACLALFMFALVENSRAERLFIVANQALVAACADRSQEPYPDVCGDKP